MSYLMKVAYRMMPRRIAQRLRNAIEYQGGVMDSYLFSASPKQDEWGVEGRFKYGYRQPAPGDEPDHRRTSVPERLDSTIYDTKYYSRDYRAKSKLVHISADEALKLKATKETSDRLAFLEGDKDLPSHPLVVEREKQGRIEEHSSKGMKIADVERYDKTGLRVFKTATWDAYKKALADDMPDHLPASWFMRHSGDGPVQGDDRANKDLDTLIMEGRALPTNPFNTQRRRTKWHYTGRV